jgi:hypothetical protein
MADLFDFELPSDFGDHIVGGGACGFVDENGAVQWAELMHDLLALIEGLFDGRNDTALNRLG